jgi:hypothetical protein
MVVKPNNTTNKAIRINPPARANIRAFMDMLCLNGHGLGPPEAPTGALTIAMTDAT